MILTIETPRAFRPLLAPARYKGAHGGRGSGKSHFFAELAIEESIRKKTDIVCVRENQKSLDQSVKKLLEAKIESLNVGSYFEVQDAKIKSKNGGVIIFQGMQNHTAESIKSLEGYSVAWVEEAQSLTQKSLDLLRPTIRTDNSELWFSWNPNLATDPIDVLLRSEITPSGAVVVEANFRDNPWFPDVLQKEMEYDRSRDPDKYAHVWLGEYQRNSETRVFRNWTVDEFDARPGQIFRLGADWGFSVDPSVLVRCWIDGNRLYVDWEAYQVGCEIVNLPELFMSVPESEKWPITADSARPETISHMKKNGFPRILPAIKGAKSLEEGVEFLKSFDIVVHRRCQHVIDELTMYSYKTDPLTNQVLPILADKDNHCFAGDTEVLTRNGTYRIMDLPPTGEVLTLWGWKPYGNPRMTRENAELVEVEFADGTTVRCTPDHEFLSSKGWIQIGMWDCRSPILRSWTTSASDSTGSSTRYLMESITSVVASALEAVERSTETFGSRLMERFRRAITSITSMVIPPTISYRTSPAFPGESIYRDIGTMRSANGLETTLLVQQGQPHRSGTDQQKDVHGIARWLRKPGAGKTFQELKSHASNAAKCLRVWTEANSAGTIANQPTIAPELTQQWLHIKRVSLLTERQNVYCLTVPDAGHFSLANGAIVSNCIDALRYALEGARRARPAPVTKKVFQRAIWAG